MRQYGHHPDCRATHGIPLVLIACLGLLALSAVYRGRSGCVAEMAETAALWIAFSAAGCVLTYLCASDSRPLQDAVISDLDHAAGFDWWAWYRFVLDRPFLHGVLSVAYASLLPQILLAVLYLPAMGRAERNIELLLLAQLTLLPTALISALWPVLGPSTELEYVPHLLAMREPGPWSFDLSSMQGIVEMPSYHTVLAILFIYAFRKTGAMGWTIAALNLVMLPSIPPFGGHYLADLFGGAALAVVAIAMLRRTSSGAIDADGKRP